MTDQFNLGESLESGIHTVEEGIHEVGEFAIMGFYTVGEFLFRLLMLYLEFFKVGMFSVGGGLATIPFLQDLGARTGWFTQGELANMIAVSESTPGPMGINMASYVGFDSAGLLGAIVATLGIITPSIAIVLFISTMLEKFQDSPVVKGVFYGIRPASAALIVAAALQVAEVGFSKETELGNVIFPAGIFLALVIWGLMYHSPWKIHPVFFVFFSGIVGMVFLF
ncbi:MAG: chromate transporter [Eubacteriales bacterium]